MPPSKVPLAAKTLQILGYDNNPTDPKVQDDSILKIQKLSSSAIIPSRGTEESVGYDIFANILETITIRPNQTLIIPTDIAASPPQGTYIRIAPRSGLSVKKN